MTGMLTSVMTEIDPFRAAAQRLLAVRCSVNVHYVEPESEITRAINDAWTRNIHNHG